MRNHYYPKTTALLLSFLLAAGTMTGCGASAATESSANESSGSTKAATKVVRAESKFGGLFLTAEDINIKDSDSYSDDWKNSKVTEITESGTITKEGTYVVSGSISGSIKVEAPEDAKVWIILNDASIESDDGPAIQVTSGDKVIISLAPGTSNSITASSISADADENAAIYSKSDLVLNGTGTMKLKSSQDGIHSTDDLRITGGTYEITASDDGLVGKDRLEITDGTFDIDAGAKGLKTTNEEDEDKGFLYISGGTFDISAKDDAVNVKTAAWITGGTFKLETGDDAIHADETLTIDDGEITVTASVEGLEAPEVVLNGGDLNITSSDDGINAAGGSTATSADADNSTAPSSDATPVSAAAGSDAAIVNAAADQSETSAATDSDQQAASDGTTEGTENGKKIRKHPDGMPGGKNGGQDGGMPGGKNGGMPGGENGQKPDGAMHGGPKGGSNGGENGQMPDGAMNGGKGGHMGGGRFDNSNSQGYLTINGGTIYVNANGDGLDANTSITQTGGDVTVEGPVSEGNGALDYNQSYDMTGGSLLAVGSGGMMQGISSGSSVPSIASKLSSALAEGDTLTIKDSSGKELKTLKLTKSIASVVFASSDLKSGETYTISNGSAEVGTATAE
ncbi:MAG: carbohydrate-binding domain-containing protein [Lachnospiraceae bacterium]|nr:carbohydrate-binding domain-containing protein [Lachnospiraceae bacterium]